MSEYHPPSSGLPDLLCSLTLVASPIYCISFVRAGKEQQKEMQNWNGCHKSSHDADSGMWSKGFCSTLKSSNQNFLFPNGSETTTLLPLLPETAAAPCQVQKLQRAAAQQLTVAGCQLGQHRWSWAPRDAGCQLPLPAAQHSSASRRAIDKNIMTARLWDTRIWKLFEDGESARRMLFGESRKGLWAEKWHTLYSPHQIEAGDGLRNNYWRVIILETDYFSRLPTSLGFS